MVVPVVVVLDNEILSVILLPYQRWQTIIRPKSCQQRTCVTMKLCTINNINNISNHHHHNFNTINSIWMKTMKGRFYYREVITGNWTIRQVVHYSHAIHTTYSYAIHTPFTRLIHTTYSRHVQALLVSLYFSLSYLILSKPTYVSPFLILSNPN